MSEQPFIVKYIVIEPFGSHKPDDILEFNTPILPVNYGKKLISGGIKLFSENAAPIVEHVVKNSNKQSQPKISS